MLRRSKFPLVLLALVSAQQFLFNVRGVYAFIGGLNVNGAGSASSTSSASTGIGSPYGIAGGVLGGLGNEAAVASTGLGGGGASSASSSAATGLGAGIGASLGAGIGSGLIGSHLAKANLIGNIATEAVGSIANTANAFGNVAVNSVGNIVNAVGTAAGGITGGLLSHHLAIPGVTGGVEGGASSSSSAAAAGAGASSSSATVSGGAGAGLVGGGGLLGSGLGAGLGSIIGSGLGVGGALGGLSGHGHSNNLGLGLGTNLGLGGSNNLGFGLGNNLGLGSLNNLGLGLGTNLGLASGLGLGADVALNEGSSMVGRQMAAGAALSALGAGAGGLALAEGAAAASAASAGANAALVGGPMLNPVLGRAGLAAEAQVNADAEAAVAGADMVAHGANNARSAALASNAYRQAKLASARDRVNIAGTVQNSARISDAAIATHDAATKAEDSLLGSELAVDSAATVLDSDGAYIPPVTNSMLRSLPYGRLSLRNILPRPLTYPGILLPDVWLNGAPVTYRDVPLRMLPYGAAGGLGAGFVGFGAGIGASASASAGALAFGGLGGYAGFGAGYGYGYGFNGQPFLPNNGGAYVNDFVRDPMAAFWFKPFGPCCFTSSIYPILANGQVEAADEVQAANVIALQQQAAAGVSTYTGFGAVSPVPMLTGSVSDANLVPTTTMGTTYPIGSALVIEPRDSFFQDYIDSSSSRQNLDERSQ